MASLPSEDTHAAGSIDTSMRTEVLQELVEIASNAANTQLDAFITRLSGALQRAAASRTDPVEAQRHTDAASLLKKNRYPFYYVASERLATALQHEIRAIENPAFAQSDTSGALKALPPDVEVDKKLCLIKASRAVEGEHIERLGALSIRLAYMFGRHELTVAENPFRPHVFLSVIHDAWCEFQPDADTHHLVFPLLGPDVCLDLAPILHSLNAALIRRGILPGLAEAYRVRKPEPDTAKEEVVADDAVTRQLRRLFPVEECAPEKSVDRPMADALPTLFEDTVVGATAARNELLSYLTLVQENAATHHPAAATNNAQHTSLLAQIKHQAPKGRLKPEDETTIDLLTKVFDTVFNEKNIPVEFKTMIATLQVPALKAALIDKGFFFEEEHPARHAIELLAKLSIEWDRKKGAADPLYPVIQRNIKRIHQESAQRGTVFSEVVADLQSFVQREESAGAQMLSAPIAHATHREKVQQAAKAAKNEVALRVDTGEVAAFVETFLEDKWVSVLTLAYTVKDEKPQAADSAIKTMDDLCWSVKPKITMAERKELLAKLPAMIAMLNKWLDLIKWNDSDRTRFFAELAACHASIVRAPLELSPERQVQLALAVAKQAAERRLQRQAAQQPEPEPEPDEFDDKVQKLACGTWIEFSQQDGTAMRVKLAWISPMRSLYIFSTRDRREALSISAEELAQSLRERRAKIMLLPGLVGRALAEALGVGSANQEMHVAKSAA